MARTHIRQHIYLLHLFIQLMTIVLAIFGLGSHYYVPSRNRYFRSPALLAYSILVFGAFASIYLNDLYRNYVNGRMQLENVNQLNGHMNIIATLCSFATGLWLHQAMPHFMNTADLRNTIDFFDMTAPMIRRPLLMVILRSIVFPLCYELILLVRQTHIDATESLWWTLYDLLPAFIAQILPNCTYGVLELWRMYLAGLNAQLRSVRDEVNRLQSPTEIRLQKPYYRMQRFCELADKLDSMLVKYMQVGQDILQYADMYAVPLLCALLCNVLSIIVGLYVQYAAIADSLINAAPFDLFHALMNGTYLIISIVQILLLTNTSNHNICALRETCIILQDISLEHADVRFKQSVETFSLIAHVNKFKITPLGLFEINATLLPDITGTVTGFALILIQSDLTLRFSLK